MKKKEPKNSPKPVEGVDYYFENGLLVMTAHFLKNRGYCCGNGCRHCPYQTNPQIDHSRKTGSSSL